ncbi:MAG: DMT family transporter [Acidimicrobiia bacterium]
MVVLLALGAGLCYALASVMQHHVAAQQAPELSLHPRLIYELAKRPLWLAGIVLDIGAYLLEAAALSVGSIVVVQPLLVSGLLFALPLSAIGGVGKPRRREWTAAIALTLGIAVFVTVGSPTGGSSQAPIWQWAIVFAICGVIALGAVVLSRGAQPHVRALSLAFATGATYAVTAALTKTVVDVLGAHGVSGVLSSWETYALAVVSVAGLILNQSAFQAGHLAASLPALAVTNPVLSSIIGITLFGETLGATGPIPIALTTLAVVVMIAGTISLSRSPLVTGENAHPAITPAAP